VIACEAFVFLCAMSWWAKAPHCHCHFVRESVCTHRQIQLCVCIQRELAMNQRKTIGQGNYDWMVR